LPQIGKIVCVLSAFICVICGSITKCLHSEDPEVRVMSWENARDKMNSSRAFRVNPVYLS
jgi:hypothetical protein